MSLGYVRIFEVGPRDGLQNEKHLVPTGDKIRLIDVLSDTGLTRIEATSFVSPKWIPQMADAAEVLSRIRRKDGVRFSALIPNMKGYENALRSGADEVAVFAAASEAFSRKNINCSIEESLQRFKPVVQAATADGIPVRGYISCAVVCPYDGAVPPEDVARLTEDLLRMGCYEVSLGDTTGAGTQETIRAMLGRVLAVAPAERLAGHYHDTGDNALENIEASLELGIRTFDTSVGGLGGCPYAPGSKGNASTGAVIRRLHKLGYRTGVDLEKLAEAEAMARTLKAEERTCREETGDDRK